MSLLPVWTPTDAAVALHEPTRRAMRVLVRACGILAAVIGAIALTGWIRDDQQLKSVFGATAGISIKTNTAVALILAGSALLLLRREIKPAWRLWLGRALACVVIAIGALTLSEHLIGWDLGIDQLLFVEAAGEPGTSSPNRMGLTASIVLPLLGIALVRMDSRSQRTGQPGRGFAVAALLLSTSPLLGYLYNANELYGIARLSGIAFETATAFALLGVGLIFARSERGITRVLIADDPGGVMLRRLLPFAVLVPLTLGWLRMQGERRGYYSSEFGVALMAFSAITVFTAIVWWTAASISRAAVERAHAVAGNAALHARLIGILENIAQGFCALDHEHRFTYVNREGERLSGLPAQELIGRKLADALPASTFPELHLAVANAVAKNETTHVEVFHPRLQRWHMHDIVPTQQGLALFMRDVTGQRLHEEERRQLLEAERSARTQAEHASAMKDEFLATLSHELRTPLNAILGWAHLLARDDVPPAELRQGLETIERNSRLQAQLIEDLLDMSRIVSGKIRLDVQTVDLAAVIDASLATITPAATAKRIRLQKVVDPRAGPIRGDPARLQQVLWNLLSNAIKFTNAGGRIAVSLARIDSHIELSVSDTGAGIAPEFLPYVFDRFRQGDASTTRRHGGLGLGLSIVRSLTELHGGRVRADSAGKGAGASFTIELPLTALVTPAEPPVRVLHPVPAPATAPVAPAPLLDGLHVLVVDDDLDARDLVARVLSGARALVTTSESAAAALAQLDQFSFDVVISDIGMPERDGYEFIAAVRQRTRERGGAVPAIALTALAREEDRRRTLLAGYQMHLAKPLQPTTLLAAVASLAGRTQQLAATGGGS